MAFASMSLLEKRFASRATLAVAACRSWSKSAVEPANGSTATVGHGYTPSGWDVPPHVAVAP